MDGDRGLPGIDGERGDPGESGFGRRGLPVSSVFNHTCNREFQKRCIKFYPLYCFRNIYIYPKSSIAHN